MYSIEHGDDAWGECGFCNGSEECVARPSERLQRAYSWTSPEKESERFVARRKERATRSMG